MSTVRIVLKSAFAAALAAIVQCTASAAPPQRYNGMIARPELERFLSRAVTMDLLHDHGNSDDEIRFLSSTGARFAGRALYLWGGEKNLPQLLDGARAREKKVHAALPDLMLQAAIFEIISEDVNTQPLPAWVCREFGVAYQPRNFSYDAMLYPDGKFKNNWRRGASVPDMSQTETQMWFYFLAATYIDLGVEAIHFGQVGLMDGRDRQHVAWSGLLARVRAYARARGRRGIVLCDAHTPTGGIVTDGRLLFDSHSFPLRIDEVPDKPMQGVLKVGYLDSLYGRSKGGITPSGWSCEHLPYLVELDNFGRSGKEGKNIGGYWIWGYDEITWFAHLPPADRDRWLRYAAKWIADHDPNGHLQMPGNRTIAVPVDGRDWYWASNPGPKCKDGFGDEATIKAIWAEAP